jgi:RNA polymerase-interacting CarD/CdnL/TRCF family regulator
MSKTTKDESITVGSKVFYPSHGPGQAVKKKSIEFGGETKDYLEFQFINMKLTVSTPIENIPNLGIRPVYSSKMIRESIKTLKTQPSLKPKVKDYTELINVIQELDMEGEIDSFVQIIQYCNNEKLIREKEGRLIPVSINKHVNTATHNIVGELALAEDVDFEKSAKTFERITGVEVKDIKRGN